MNSITSHDRFLTLSKKFNSFDKFFLESEPSPKKKRKTSSNIRSGFTCLKDRICDLTAKFQSCNSKIELKRLNSDFTTLAKSIKRIKRLNGKMMELGRLIHNANLKFDPSIIEAFRVLDPNLTDDQEYVLQQSGKDSLELRRCMYKMNAVLAKYKELKRAYFECNES